MTNFNVLSRFSDTDKQRIDQTFDHLLPHIAPNEYAVVGGLVIRYIVAGSGQVYPSRAFNDLDIIIKNRESVSPSIAKEFKIAHVHGTNTHPYLAIIDPKTRVKVDLFAWPVCEPTITNIACGTHSLPFQGPEDQLAKTIWDTTKVLRGECVEPKQFLDAKLLAKTTDAEKTSRIFMVLYGGRTPFVESAQEAFDLAQQAASDYPELVRPKPFRLPLPSTCQECVTLPDYPLTTLPEIYNLLGYVDKRV